MINNCEAVQDLLIPYINRQLSLQENTDIILHMTQCPECRKEAAELILLQKQMSGIIVDIPQKLRSVTFNKLEQSIEFSELPCITFETIYYISSLCRKIINFAWKVI